MLANETFYSALIILIFIFSDATPQLNIKVSAGVCLITAIFLLVLANIVFIGYLAKKGKENLKVTIREAKAKRIEEEEQERKEEEERREKKRKEEEEFSKLPDDTTNNATNAEITNTTMHGQNNTTMADLKGKSSQKNKMKANVDDVVSSNGPSGGQYSTAKKSGKATDAVTTEYNTDQKLMGGKSGKKQISADEKSSGDSDPKGAILGPSKEPSSKKRR